MSKQGRPAYLTEAQRLDALQLWNQGNDTLAIANYFGVHESVIYNGLPKWRVIVSKAA